MRARRLLTPFSLSFLDIMSCGFGSVVLLFLIIKHNVDTNVPIPTDTRDQTSEVMLLEEEILEGERNLAKTRNTISEVDEQLVVAQGMARRIMEKIQETRSLARPVDGDHQFRGTGPAEAQYQGTGGTEKAVAGRNQGNGK